jgi:hypothetical protein
VYQKGRAAEVVAPAADTGDDSPGLATLLVLAAATAGDTGGGGAAGCAPAAGGAPAASAPAAGAPAAVKQKKRKPQFSPNPNEDPTSSQEEKDDDIDNSPTRIVPPPPPAPLEGLRSPTEPFSHTELEDMHSKIVPKCAPLIDGFGALNIYEVSYVEQKLQEIKIAFKKDYDRNIQYVKFLKKGNKQVETEFNDDVKGGAKGRKKK